MRNFTALEKAILEQIDDNRFLTEDNAIELQTCIKGGADAGITGFIYYADTCGFYDNNRGLILSAMIEDCQNYGYKSVANMVANFACLHNGYSEAEIEEMLLTGNEDTTIKNALAWAALESFAFGMEEEIERFLEELE